MNPQSNLLQPRRAIYWVLVIQFVFVTMCFEGSLVVLSLYLLSVARLKECLFWQQGVGVPLLWKWVEGWISKEILGMLGVGRATTEKLEGRSIPGRRRRSREFDVTPGYPGEDIGSVLWMGYRQ